MSAALSASSLLSRADHPVYVIGAGAQTPVGRGVLAAGAAVRCGVAGFAEHPFLLDQHCEPMVVARAPWLDARLPVTDRVVALAVGAAREAAVPLADGHASMRLRVYLVLAAETFPTADACAAVADAFADGLSSDLAAGRFTCGPVCVHLDGHAGALAALGRATEELRRGRADTCLIVGADSWLDPDRLEALDFAGRLHSASASWGVTPGEAAGAYLLASGAATQAAGWTPAAEVFAVATALEPNLLGTRTVCVGEGLTAAFRGALAGVPARAPASAPGHPPTGQSAGPPLVTDIYCDLNAEPYRADEFAFTATRTASQFEDVGRFTAGSSCWGDVGAASGVLALVLPLAAWSRGYAHGPTALAWASSASAPLRGAALLGAPHGWRPSPAGRS